MLWNDADSKEMEVEELQSKLSDVGLHGYRKLKKLHINISLVGATTIKRIITMSK